MTAMCLLTTFRIYLIFIFDSYFHFVPTNCSALIEKCPLPWQPYSAGKSKSHCTITCAGNAFHTNDGRLICFHGKEVARYKLYEVDGQTKKGTCDCGLHCQGKIIHRYFLPCNFHIRKTSQNACKEMCGKTIVYVYKRNNRKQIAYCENYERNKFYNLVGEIRYLKNDTAETDYNFTYRECHCGINNTNSNEISTSADISIPDKLEKIFEECVESWSVFEIFKARTLKTCEKICSIDICQKGKGFYYLGKPFCYKYSVKTQRRPIHQGGTNGTCECGHNKNPEIRSENKDHGRTTKRKFISCAPKIGQIGLNRIQCNKFCGKAYAFYKTSNKPTIQVRCIYKPNFQVLKPQTLKGKCDAEIYTREINLKNYTKCRCGLDKPLESATNLLESRKLLADWAVKKKRTLRNHESLIKTKENANG